MGTIVASLLLAWSAAVWLNLSLSLSLSHFVSLGFNRAALAIAHPYLLLPQTVLYVGRIAGGYPKPWDSLAAV